MEASKLDAELQSALESIDPATLTYDEWLVIMGALKDAGADYADADLWCQRDQERYDEPANRRHWDSLQNPTSPDIARRTIFRFANDLGWRWRGESTAPATPRPARQSASKATTYPILDLKRDVQLPTPPDLSPADQARAQIEAMFHPEEIVNTFITAPWFDEKREKWQPVGHGEFSHSASWMEEGRAESALQAVNPEAGAWVRVNPMRAGGGADADVTAFRHVLVESDSLPRDRQLEIYIALNLPCAAIVDSAGKSVHALVKVDAATAEQYRSRVKWLYGLLEANGLHPDAANKNAARWSRLAGAARNGSVQQLVATDVGAPSWDEWRAWVDAQAETRREPSLRLPTWHSVRATNPPKPAPELVEGLLRVGHTGLLVAKAKSNKSWAMVALCIAIATGGEWLGHKCVQGASLFLDPELDPKSTDRRFALVADAMGVDRSLVEESVIRWSLRGALTDKGMAPTIADVAHDLEELVAAGTIRCGQFSLVVVDSCSALLPGDENAAPDVRAFHGWLLRISELLGASVFAVHHEGKVNSGDVDAIDRGRGSSAWSDCFDLVLSLAETFPPNGSASDYLGDGKRAFTLEVAAIREFPLVQPERLVWSFPCLSLDTDGTTADWKHRSGQQTGGQRSGDGRKARAEQRAARCESAVLARMYRDGIGDEGLPLQDAMDACADLLGEDVPAATLKRYAEKWELLDLYKPSPRRCVVVARHPQKRGQPLPLPET